MKDKRIMAMILVSCLFLIGADECSSSHQTETVTTKPRSTPVFIESCVGVKTVHWREFCQEDDRSCWPHDVQSDIYEWLERAGSTCDLLEVVRHKDRRGRLIALEVWTEKPEQE